MKLLKAITDIILLEFSDKLVKELILKFQSQDNEVSELTIRTYIKKFDELKNSPKIKEKDIMKYSWSELEDIVDENLKNEIKVGKIDVNLPDSNLIYKDDNIRVYEANSREACVKYGQGYSFCISSRSDDESYMDYRIYEHKTPYFVFFDKKSFEKKPNGRFVDPTHLLVLMINSFNTIEVSTADNPETPEKYNLEGLIYAYPELEPVKELLVSLNLNIKDILTRQVKRNYHQFKANETYLTNKNSFKGNYIGNLKHIFEILDGKIQLYDIKLNYVKALSSLTKKENPIKDEYLYNFGFFYIKNGQQLQQVLNEIVTDEFNNFKSFIKNKTKFSVNDFDDYEIMSALYEALETTNLTDELKDFVNSNANELIPIFERIAFLDKKLKSDLNKINMGIYDNLFFRY